MSFESSASDLQPTATPEPTATTPGPLETAWKAAEEYKLHDASTWPAEAVALLSLDDKPVMFQGLPALLSGAGGLGKSTLLLDLCVTVAGGKSAGGERGQWCGFNVARGRAIYIGAEDGLRTIYQRVGQVVRAATDGAEGAEDEYQRRLEALGKSLKLVSLSGAGAGACTLVERLNDGSRRFTQSANATTLLQLAEEWAAEGDDGATLIVFDPGSRFLGSEAETDPGGATAGIEALAKFTTVKGGPAVLTAMHVTKSSKERGDASVNDVRGSAALSDGSRNVLGMTALAPGFAKLSHVKANDCEQVAPIYLQRVDGGMWETITQADAERATGQAMAEERRRAYVNNVAGWIAATRRALDHAKGTADGHAEAAAWALEVMAEWKWNKTRNEEKGRFMLPPWDSVAKFKALSAISNRDSVYYSTDTATLKVLEEVQAEAGVLVDIGGRVAQAKSRAGQGATTQNTITSDPLGDIP